MSTNTPQRIDVHTHVVPPLWAQDLPSHGGDPSGWSVPEWSPEAHLAYMNDNAIATSMPSLTAPSVVGWQGDERRAMARRVNEYVAGLAKEHPGRFGNLATIPLPDAEGAVTEAAYALDELGADGVTLMSNYDGVYLGDSRFEPLWRFLDERGAVVFIHPAHPQMENLDGVPGPVVDYPFDTTRNAVHMVYNGILDRFADTKIILSHAGGFVPFSARRFAEVGAMLHPDGPSADDLLGTFRRFYFDTALSSGRSAISSLVEFADPERILFGSDFPYAPARIAGKFTMILDSDSGLSDEQKSAIYTTNAHKIFNLQKRGAGA